MDQRPEQIFNNTVSPVYLNALKFILLQDPIKIALGAALALATINMFTGILDQTVKPIVSIFLHSLSETGFSYTYEGITVNLGAVIEQIIIYLIIILLLYYLFARPVMYLRKKYNVEQKTVKCPYCITAINESATRCPAYTSI